MKLTPGFPRYLSVPKFLLRSIQILKLVYSPNLLKKTNFVIPGFFIMVTIKIGNSKTLYNEDLLYNAEFLTKDLLTGFYYGYIKQYSFVPVDLALTYKGTFAYSKE